MSSLTSDVRLRIPSFEVPPHAASGDNDKDIIFLLKCHRLEFMVSDSVLVAPNAAFLGGYIVPLLVIKEEILLEGIAYDNGHTSHPVSTATEHEPDFVDIEEAAVTWSGQAPLQLCHLETEFDGSNWRVYQGLLLQTTIVREAGQTAFPFSIRFGVLFDTSASRALPGIREWS